VNSSQLRRQTLYPLSWGRSLLNLAGLTRDFYRAKPTPEYQLLPTFVKFCPYGNNVIPFTLLQETL
jgi:hypothetical protein